MEQKCRVGKQIVKPRRKRGSASRDAPGIFVPWIYERSRVRSGSCRKATGPEGLIQKGIDLRYDLGLVQWPAGPGDWIQKSRDLERDLGLPGRPPGSKTR